MEENIKWMFMKWKYEVTNLLKYYEGQEQGTRGVHKEGTYFEVVIIFSHPSEEL